MKNLNPITVIFFALLFATSCKKDIQSSDSAASNIDENLISDFADSLPAVQTPVSYNVDANIGGYLQALPSSYTTKLHKHYPLIIFLHGQGELGNGTTDLYKVSANSIPALIKYGTFPPSFLVNKHNYSFIVISPQFKAWPQPVDVNSLLNYVKNKYRIDTTKMYLCGLSMGGGGVWETAATAYGKSFAAIVPMAGASYPTTQKAQVIVNSKIAVWAFHNSGDGTVPSWYSTDYVKYINSYSPLIPAKLTLFNATGHNCWGTASDPSYKEAGKNIYEWMLGYSKLP